MNVTVFNEGKRYAITLINQGIDVNYPVITSYDDKDDHWFQQGVLDILDKTDKGAILW